MRYGRTTKLLLNQDIHALKDLNVHLKESSVLVMDGQCPAGLLHFAL